MIFYPPPPKKNARKRRKRWLDWLQVPRDDRYGPSYRSRSTSSRRSCQSTSSWRRSRGATRGSGSGSLCTEVPPFHSLSTAARAQQCCGSGSVGPICYWDSRIRIHLGRYTDPDPSISSSKNSKKNIDSYCFVTSLWLFIFEKLCKWTFKKWVISKNLETK